MTTSDRTQWPIVWLTVAGGIVAALHVGKISPALPALRGDLELSLVQGGFVVSMFYVLGMTLGMVVGVMVDRLGRRALIAAGFRSARQQRAAIMPTVGGESTQRRFAETGWRPPTLLTKECF